MTSQQEVSNSFFLVHFLSQNLKLFLYFMAFTGNFYDWIWFSRVVYWPSNSPYSSDSFLYKWGENGSFFLDTWTWQCVMDFPTILPRKKGENLKRRRRDCGCRLFSDWLEIERRDWKKDHINKRKKCQFYGSFTFLSTQTLYWLLNSFNWLISFQIDHLDNSWSITHSICCSWKKSIDFWLSAASCAKTWSNYQQRPQDINNIPIKYPEGPTTFSHLLLHWS